MGEELDIQLPQDPTYLRLHEALQRLLPMREEAAALVAGEAELGVVLSIEDPGPTIALQAWRRVSRLW
jgi:hypothetical protein